MLLACSRGQQTTVLFDNATGVLARPTAAIFKSANGIASGGNVSTSVTLTSHAVVLGAGTTNIGVVSSLGTSGYVLTSNGAGSDPSWQAGGGGGATWGSITGTLSSQTDLQSALDAKQPLDAALTALAAGSDFVQFTGPLSTTKVFTLPNASATILTSNAAVTAAQGGFGSDVSGSSGVPLFAAGTPTFTSTSGSGNFARVTSPTFVTPTLGAALATSINGNTFTTGTYTLTGTAGKTLNFTNTLTLSGTDSTIMTFPSTSATIARTDAANTFTGTQTIGALVATTFNGNTFTTGTGVLTIAASKTATFSNTLTLAGTDSTTMTFPSTTATIARTDAANTFTGASTASAWVLTSPTITTKISPTSDDGAPLGDTTHNFSDLFLASGAVVNYANSNVVLTHTSGVLTLGTGNLIITTAGTAAGSVATISGTQTLTNKSIVASQLTGQVAQSNGGTAGTSVTGQLTFVIPSTGSAIATGTQTINVQAPHDGTITGWTILGTTSGSIVIDIWKDTYANFPPTVADTITASAKPTVTTATKATSTTLTSWTTSITKGDVFKINVDSVTSMTDVVLVVAVTWTNLQ